MSGTLLVMMLRRSKTEDNVPYRNKEEVERWNNHMENHRKRINGTRATVTSRSKADQQFEILQRGILVLFYNLLIGQTF